MFDWIRRPFKKTPSSAEHYEQFVRDFVTECQRQNIRPKSYDPQARAFVFKGDDDYEMTFHMYNMFGEWLSRNKDGRAELIVRFVRSAVEAIRNNAISPERLPGELMPGIRSRAQISNVLIKNWIAGAPPDDSSATAFLPLVGDLVLCALRDMLYGMSQMTRSNLAFANLPLKQAIPRNGEFP